MNIHEYQGKAILKAYGANVSAGYPAMTVAEAVEAAKKLPGPLFAASQCCAPCNTGSTAS